MSKNITKLDLDYQKPENQLKFIAHPDTLLEVYQMLQIFSFVLADSSVVFINFRVYDTLLFSVFFCRLLLITVQNIKSNLDSYFRFSLFTRCSLGFSLNDVLPCFST